MYTVRSFIVNEKLASAAALCRLRREQKLPTVSEADTESPSYDVIVSAVASANSK